MSKKLILPALFILVCNCLAFGNTVINVKAPKGDATATLAKALKKAAAAKSPVEIRLEPGIYRLHRDKASVRSYRVSNTASESEHPTALKHIGLLMKGLSGLTINGQGKALILTHGEMTPWVMDSCTNITVKGLTIDSDDTSVPEMTVTGCGPDFITARINPGCRYEIRDGKLWWIGHGWEFTDGIAQIHQPDKGTSTRCHSPVAMALRAEETAPGIVKLTFAGNAPECRPGDTFQMRHSIRNEVAGLISHCSDITLSDLHLAFLGNFGIVAQMSTNLTYTRIDCSPRPETGRVNAGFADFFQVSGCNGTVNITQCNFAGSHDDPINIHGTHQSVTNVANGKISVRYMHPQTFGFNSFISGDTISFTDPVTLLPQRKAIVESAEMTDPYTTTLTLTPATAASALGTQGMIVENITRTPAVNITGCHFTLTPTRGILVSTLRPVSITDCTFTRCPMAAILIADDGRSWYESGPVTNVIIANNRFINCASPVIAILPEAENVPGRYVHSNIKIIDNEFISDFVPSISARSTDGLIFTGNKAADATGRTLPMSLDAEHVKLISPN